MTNEISLGVKKLPQVIQGKGSHRHGTNKYMSQIIAGSFYWFWMAFYWGKSYEKG